MSFGPLQQPPNQSTNLDTSRDQLPATFMIRIKDQFSNQKKRVCVSVLCRFLETRTATASPSLSGRFHVSTAIMYLSIIRIASSMPSPVFALVLS